MSKEPSLYKDKVHNGSCITYSAIEAYILSKLHVNGNHINLLLRSRVGAKPNSYWIYCQNALRKNGHGGDIINFSHWASVINFKNGGDIRLRASNKQYHDLLKINFVKDRELFVKLLLFPILDSYKVYLRQLSGVITINLDTENGAVQKDVKVSEYVSKIFNFIQARYNMIDKKINNKARSYLSFGMITRRNSKYNSMKRKAIVSSKQKMSKIKKKKNQNTRKVAVSNGKPTKITGKSAKSTVKATKSTVNAAKSTVKKE
jgi:hypothetical protein